jgi:hypothetical protein
MDNRDEPLRKWLHDLNNRVGMILANAELLQMEKLSPKAIERSRNIEAKALEAKEIIIKIGDHFFEE